MPRMRALLVAVVLASVIAACGGHTSTPTQPTNSGGGGGTTACTPPANTPPVVVSITAQGARKNEPADFADVGESIPVAAVVQDAETPVDQLQLAWTATVGTFSGSGTSVIWQAPANGSTPLDVTITLTVVENYGCTGQPPSAKNTVTATHTISLHDSAKEVGDMARQFLLDFSDSTIDTATVMRNFETGCYGTADETQQVTANRQKFTIVRSNIGPAAVTEPFGNSLCPIPGRIQRGDACSSTPSHWESIQRSNGHLQVADGVDWVAAYYRSAIKAWRLCDSQFVGTCTDATTGGPCSDAQMQGMVPGRWKPEVPIAR